MRIGKWLPLPGGSDMVPLMAAACLLALLVGCNATEAVVDGFYGGISDSVAATISGVILGALGAAGG